MGTVIAGAYPLSIIAIAIATQSRKLYSKLNFDITPITLLLFKLRNHTENFPLRKKSIGTNDSCANFISGRTKNEFEVTRVGFVGQSLTYTRPGYYLSVFKSCHMSVLFVE